MVAALALTLLGLCGVASNASASYHLMKVREVSPGNGSPNTSYIEIQMYAPGQEFLSLGAKLVVCNNICSILPAEFTGFSNVAQGANQSTVVVGDSAAPSKDFTRDLNLESVMAGGAACYVSEPGYSDCVSWGNFSANSTLTANYGTSADSGAPAPALTSGMALRRSVSAGCPSALESGDDTNNSAADFAVTTPNPRPNSVAPSETTCGASTPPTGYPTQPGGSSATKKKKKCKKKKHRSAYAAKKKCKKRRK